jgi:DNA-binding transcriptional LysR family regulator
LHSYHVVMPLSSHVPELSALEVLLAVARAGSLNAAAAEVGVSQQAISSRVRSLEAQTGVVVLRRGARGSQLTSDGVVVAEWAARLLEVAAEFDAGLASLRQDRRDRLRVSASLTIAEQLLPGWLVSFQTLEQRHTGHPTEIELTAANSDTVVAHVRDGAADVGFIEGPHLSSMLRSRIVGHDQLTVVVAPSHPWARRRNPVTPAELAATPLVTREHGSGTREALTAALRGSLGSTVQQAAPVLSLSTTAAVRAAVVAGAGAAVLSELAVRDDLERRRLVAVQVDGLDLNRALRAIWHGTRQPPAGAARDLITHITARRRSPQTS